MKPHTKSLNTKLQKLIADCREAGLRPAFGDANERAAYDRAMWHLTEFVTKYGDRLQVNDAAEAARAPERSER